MQNFSSEYENLSIEEKIGQLFFIGIPSEELDLETTDLLDEIKPGGICLFARNTKNAAKIRKLLNDISEQLSFQPFLSLDQEGGLVDRLRRVVEPMPSIKEITSANAAQNVEILANLTAEIIRIIGFNMNFAPVVDVTNTEREKFVMNNQKRTFGNSTEEVIELSSDYLENLQNGGIIGCIKHFPGIGAVQFDPHDELPSVKITEEELRKTDLLPFIKHLENEKIFAVMTGHVTFPMLDLQEFDSNGKLLPSSLSQNIITKLLRDELGFENLVLTDDLEMGAVVKNYGIGEASKMAFLAGSDFILICNSQDAVRESFKAIMEAVESGEITEKRLDQSLERIFRVRQKLSKPLEFDENRLKELSLEIKKLKESL